MKALFLKISVFSFLLTLQLYPNILLQAPEHFSDAQVEQLVKDWNSDFTWRFKDGLVFSCYYANHQSYLMLRYWFLPIWSYNYPYCTQLKNLLFGTSDTSLHSWPDPVVLPSGNAIPLKGSDIPKLLHNKRCIFYTGDGISVASGVTTMEDLENSLHINRSQWELLKTIFCNPKMMTHVFKKFVTSCIHKEPTPAHWAVHAIAKHRSCAIVTEAFDLLHHKTHSLPILERSILLQAVTPTDLQEVDIIICVGLSPVIGYINRGFLAYYKQHNPHGIIIAVDMEQPNYLFDTDYLVEEDVQIVLPWLASVLVTEKEN